MGHQHAYRAAQDGRHRRVHQIPGRVQVGDLPRHELACEQDRRHGEHIRALQRGRHGGHVAEPAEQAQHEDHGIALDAAGEDQGQG
jgi:hypothetical protein